MIEWHGALAGDVSIIPSMGRRAHVKGAHHGCSGSTLLKSDVSVSQFAGSRSQAAPVQATPVHNWFWSTSCSC